MKVSDVTGIVRKGVANGASLGSNGVTQALDAGGDRNRFINEVTPVISHAVRSTRINENHQSVPKPTQHMVNMKSILK